MISSKIIKLVIAVTQIYGGKVVCRVDGALSCQRKRYDGKSIQPILTFRSTSSSFLNSGVNRSLKPQTSVHKSSDRTSDRTKSIRVWIVLYCRSWNIVLIIYIVLWTVDNYRKYQNTRQSYFSSCMLPSEYRIPHRPNLPLSFRCMSFVNNALRMKIPLNYTIRVYILQAHPIALVVAWRHSYRLFDVFFFVDTPCTRLYELRYSPRPYLYGERYNPQSCSIAQSRRCSSWNWRRTALLFTVFAALATLPIKDPSAPNIVRNGNTLSCFAIEIRFFIIFLFVIFFFGFMTMPILILTFIARRQRPLSRLESNLLWWRVLAVYRRVPRPLIYRWDCYFEKT